MVGGRFEDRVKVNSGNAQVLQIVQLVKQTLQIPAVEVLAVGACAVISSARVTDSGIPILFRIQ